MDIMAPWRNIANTKLFAIPYILFILPVINYIILKQSNISGNDYVLGFFVICAILLILLEIYLKLNVNIILLETLFLSFVIHLLFVPQYGLLGPDAQYDFNLMKLIHTYGWSLGLSSTLAPWPAEHIFLNICSEITGVSLFNSARYMPSLVSTTVLLFYFCLVKRIYKEQYTALYGTILLSIISYFVFFHSIPVRESFAFVLFVASIDSYIRAINESNVRNISIAIFFVSVLIISHHFTMFIYDLFIFSFIITTLIFKTNILKSKLDNSKTKFNYRHTYLLLVLVASLSYWVFISIRMFSAIIFSIHNIIALGDASTVVFFSKSVYLPINNIRVHIYNYSKILVFLITIYLIIKEYKNKKRLNIYECCIFILLSIIFLEWIVIIFHLVDMPIFAERFELFAWIFLLIILSPIIYKSFSINGSLDSKITSLLFILFFITMNVSQISPNLYNPSIKPEYNSGYVRSNYLQQEYSAVDWFKGEGIVQSDASIEDLLIHNLNGKIRTDPNLFEGNLSTITNYNWVIIRKEMFNRIIEARKGEYTLKKPLKLTTKTFNLITNNKNTYCIYSNGEVDIFSIH